MAVNKIEWNYDALPQIRRNQAVTQLLESLGRKYLAAANATLPSGHGYAMGSHPGPGRYGRHIVNIYTREANAIASNARHQTLAKLL